VVPPELAFDIPAGLSEKGQQNYERLASLAQTQAGTIRAAEEKIPRVCDAESPECKAALHEIALLLLDHEQSRRLSYFCPGTSKEAKAFAEVERRIKARLLEQHEGLIRKIIAAIPPGAAAPEKVWEGALTQARAARPMPCLSFGCGDW